jgi:hypothetical protein
MIVLRKNKDEFISAFELNYIYVHFSNLRFEEKVKFHKVTKRRRIKCIKVINYWIAPPARQILSARSN